MVTYELEVVDISTTCNSGNGSSTRIVLQTVDVFVLIVAITLAVVVLHNW